MDMTNLLPEVTVNLDGVFWHPLSTDADMQVGKKILPLASAVERIQGQLDAMTAGGAPLSASSSATPLEMAAVRALETSGAMSTRTSERPAPEC